MSTVEDLLRANERLPHRAHQLIGVEALLKNPYFLLADEVGAGKTKQVIDAAQILFQRGDIDTVLVVTPGFARSTWAEEDPLLGEVAKHAWDAIPNVIHEYRSGYDTLAFIPGALNWVISNYEFVRRADRLYDLDKMLRTRRMWLVLDESWALSGNSQQMRACRQLRNRRAVRVTELNGTPLSDGAPEDLFYPLSILSTGILGMTSQASFRSKYCVMGGYDNRKVVRYQNLDDFNRRIAPFVLSRRTRDCFDLPPMLPPVIIEARMQPTEWDLYKGMRDEMVASLGGEVTTAQQAIVKSLRLAQICSGFLGGLEDLGVPAAPPVPQLEQQPAPGWLRRIHGEQASAIQGQGAASSQAPASSPVGLTGSGGLGAVAGRTPTGLIRETGRGKLDALFNWLDTWNPIPTKLLVWCRFTAELERTTRELATLQADGALVFPHIFNLRGDQSDADRRAAKEFLAPPDDGRRGAVIGNQKAGGASLNFAAASVAVYMSNGPALIERTQSIGRIERPGASKPMLIVDVVASGPKGQKTFDHAVLRALRAKDDMAKWTVQQWRDLLKSC